MAHPLLDAIRVAPGTPAGLADRDPRDKLGLAGKDEARAQVTELVTRLSDLQARLWAENRRSVLLVLQGLDASGKDGTIRRIFTGLNPQGCTVASFRAPTHEELDHDYLWRIHAACPTRGQIGIFNRSHYEDVVTTRVLGLVDDATVARRVGQINAFERTLDEEGTTMIKVFLNMSKEEQRLQLQDRVDDPDKRWKMRMSDLETRRQWDEYRVAYDRALSATSTAHAPWYVVPADRKWVRDAAVAALLVHTIEDLDPRFPAPEEDLTGVVVE
jgi:PPK2 family polyphosphate:nucleotide phosphotransferase